MIIKNNNSLARQIPEIGEDVATPPTITKRKIKECCEQIYTKECDTQRRINLLKDKKSKMHFS